MPSVGQPALAHVHRCGEGLRGEENQAANAEDAHERGIKASIQKYGQSGAFRKGVRGWGKAHSAVESTGNVARMENDA